MQADNPLTLDFLKAYPVESARVLEKLPSGDVSALLETVQMAVSVPVLETMLPHKAAECVMAMKHEGAANILAELAMPKLLVIFRMLSGEKQQAIMSRMDKGVLKKLQKHIDHEALTAGDLMDPAVIMMPENLSVSDTLSRLGQTPGGVGCELFVVDSAHRLVGSIAVDRLLKANKRSRLAEIMSASVRPVPVRAPLRRLLKPAIWMKSRRLPVVETDNTLIGFLEYARLKELSGNQRQSQEADNSALTLLGLYCFFLAELAAAFLSLFPRNPGGRK